MSHIFIRTLISIYNKVDHYYISISRSIIAISGVVGGCASNIPDDYFEPQSSLLLNIQLEADCNRMDMLLFWTQSLLEEYRQKQDMFASKADSGRLQVQHNVLPTIACNVFSLCNVHFCMVAYLLNDEIVFFLLIQNHFDLIKWL